VAAPPLVEPKVTPAGRAPVSVMDVTVGLPVVVTLNVLAPPMVKVA
jgi:hypothetical protein